MDRQLAERMVGAACLLAVLVLVVPAILDGNPDPGATITHPSVESVEDEPQGLRTRTILLDRAERAPAEPVGQPPAASPAISPEVASQPAPASEPEPQAEPQPEPTPVPAPETRPVAATAAVGKSATDVGAPQVPAGNAAAGVAAASGGDWIVQLGSFSRRENADRLAADLRDKGFTASVLGGGGASGALFRVRAGPTADRVAAEALAGRLAAAGFRGGQIGRQ